MKVKLEKGYAIEKDVEVVINSANCLLMLGSSGAGKIRNVSENLSKEDIVEYEYLFKQLPVEIQKFILHEYEEKDWDLKYAQLSSVKLLLKNEFPFALGDAVLDKEWSKNNHKKIIHAITMGYSTSWPPQRIWGSIESIKNSFTKALEICKNIKAKTIAIPIPVSRKGYGIGANESYKVVREVLNDFQKENFEITLCFDNKDTEELLDEIL